MFFVALSFQNLFFLINCSLSNLSLKNLFKSEVTKGNKWTQRRKREFWRGICYLFDWELFAGRSWYVTDLLCMVVQTQSHNLLQSEVCTGRVKCLLHFLPYLIPMSKTNRSTQSFEDKIWLAKTLWHWHQSELIGWKNLLSKPFDLFQNLMSCLRASILTTYKTT